MYHKKHEFFKKCLVFPLLFLIFSLFPSFLQGQMPFSSQNQSDSLRSFSEIFPNISGNQKIEAFSEEGLIRSLEKNESLELIPSRNSGINLYETIMKENLSYLAESILILPYSGKTLDKLDAYNALGKIRDLKGRLYHSHTRDADVPLFEDATRIESARKNNPVPDPAFSKELPSSEIIYIRLKDINFGNCFYRGEVSVSPFGVTYSLKNFKAITYLLFTVMKEEKFSAILYMEPITEGMLIYSVAGADASDFIAKRVDIPSAISKRLAVFIGWISDGLKGL